LPGFFLAGDWKSLFFREESSCDGVFFERDARETAARTRVRTLPGRPSHAPTRAPTRIATAPAHSLIVGDVPWAKRTLGTRLAARRTVGAAPCALVTARGFGPERSRSHERSSVRDGSQAAGPRFPCTDYRHRVVGRACRVGHEQGGE